MKVSAKSAGPAGWLSWLSIFTSAGTLVCCALPATLVAVGAGAAMAGIVSTVPQLVWLSESKGVVFGVAGAMLALAGWMQYRARFAPCPADPRLAAECLRMRRTSRRVYAVSLGTFAIGAFFAFVASALT
jgi:hypothetical protein